MRVQESPGRLGQRAGAESVLSCLKLLFLEKTDINAGKQCWKEKVSPPNRMECCP